METPSPTLRSLIRSEQLIPLEPRTASVLKKGYRVLYLPESIDLDAKLESVRAAVEVVMVDVSTITGGFSVKTPGTLNTLGVETLPRSDRGTVRFYFMPVGGAIPEWTLTNDVPNQEFSSNQRPDFGAESSNSYGDPKLNALLKECSSLHLDVLMLFYRRLSQPDIDIQVSRGNVFISLSGKSWEEVFSLFATQFKIHSVSGVDEKAAESHLATHPALQDLFRLIHLIMQERKIRYGYGANTRQVSGDLTQDKSSRFTRLRLSPEF